MSRNRFGLGRAGRYVRKAQKLLYLELHNILLRSVVWAIASLGQVGDGVRSVEPPKQMRNEQMLKEARKKGVVSQFEKEHSLGG